MGAASFRNFLVEHNIIDIPSQGGWLTWCNNRKDVVQVKEKLDRALCNSLWMQSFPSSSLQILAIVVSDHSPLFFQSHFEKKGAKLFRFVNFWLSFPQCHDIVLKEWTREVYGSSACKKAFRLKCIRKALISWNNLSVGRISSNIQELKNDLQFWHNKEILYSKEEHQVSFLKISLEFGMIVRRSCGSKRLDKIGCCKEIKVQNIFIVAQHPEG